MLGYRLIIGLAMLAFGCANRAPYVCSSSDQCVDHGNTGVCEDTGFCSFPDSTCDQGRRYEPNAGGELGGTCIPAPPPPPVVVACGNVGAACCASGPACIGGASCDNGTCQACVTDVALGRRFSCTLHRDATVWCSGDNGRGQLGIGLSGTATATPAQVRDESSAVIADATAVASGREHACAIRGGGSVWCWGLNNTGQLGTGDNNQRAAAAAVIKTDNTPLNGIVQLAPGDNQTCARDAKGGVWCWGDNSQGQLGDGTTTGRNKAAPVLVAAGGAAFSDATNLATGARHLCAQKAPDEVWCWGANSNGQLGDGTMATKSSPIKVYAATKIGLGRWHTCAVNMDATVSCWGWNGLGRLGIGVGASFDGGNQPIPGPVLERLGGAAFQDVEAVADGGVSCALMRDHHVSCWGDDPYGQTGTGAGSVVPVEVVLANGMPLTNVERLSSSHAHVCAFRTGGEIMCWGRNTEGTFGNGTFLNQGFPTPLSARCL